eukprot:759047-Hanusia_phi.AAC.1
MEEVYGVTPKGEDRKSLAEEFARTACGRAKLEAKKIQQMTQQHSRSTRAKMAAVMEQQADVSEASVKKGRRSHESLDVAERGGDEEVEKVKTCSRCKKVEACGSGPSDGPFKCRACQRAEQQQALQKREERMAAAKEEGGAPTFLVSSSVSASLLPPPAEGKEVAETEDDTGFTSWSGEVEAGGAGAGAGAAGSDSKAPTCPYMCSKKEYDDRRSRGNFAFSVMERDRETLEPSWPALVVCRYEFHRGGAGAAHAGSDMRTLQAMHDTIDHCRRLWMRTEMMERCPGGYVGVYKVLHDVIKAISSDMAFLHDHYPPSPAVASVFERVLRIALDAHYRLAEDMCVEMARGKEWASERLKTHGITNQ